MNTVGGDGVGMNGGDGSLARTKSPAKPTPCPILSHVTPRYRPTKAATPNPGNA